MKNKMWVIGALVFIALGLIWTAAPVQADGEPGKIIYKDTKSFAPVVFDHQSHKGTGLGCGDCHDALFRKKQGSADANNALTMKTLRKGKFCGACHDGSRAFSVRKSCKKCHNSK